MNNVRFNPRPNNKKDPLIQLVYRYEGGRKLVMSTKLHVPDKYWDRTRMRAKNTVNYPKYNAINTKLNDLENALEEAESFYRSKGQIPPTKILKEKIIEIQCGKSEKSEKERDVASYIEAYIERREEENRITTGTLQAHKQMLKAWKAYTNNRIMEFDEITVRQLLKFHEFMIENFKYSLNQREKIQRKLVEVLSDATTKGLNTNLEYKSKIWKVKKKENDSDIYLTNKEINRIKNYDFSKFPNLGKIRDRWIIGFRSGQRYGDFKTLNIDNVIEEDGKYYLDIIQEKTMVHLKIPLFNDIKTIFDKYEGFPPVYSDQYFNKMIKDIAKIIELDTIVIKRYYITEREYTEERVEKWKLVTSHICRRSFATNGIKKGFSPSYLMKITGHSNLKTFSTYIKLNLDDVSQNISEEIFE